MLGWHRVVFNDELVHLDNFVGRWVDALRDNSQLVLINMN